MTNNLVKVWDPLVRIFHWSLVVFFTIAYLTDDDFALLHDLSGYIVLGLVVFRIIWGFVGSAYARFGNFIYSPATIIRYLKDFLAAKPKHYLGHNPAGGAMVIVLLFMVGITAWSGHMLHETESGEHAGINISIIKSVSAHGNERHEKEAESGERQDGGGDELWEEIHEVSADLTMLLVLIHIAGVMASSLIHRENLVKSMFTGYKNGKED